jgi:hypothetical protein
VTGTRLWISQMFVWVLQHPKCYNPQLDSRGRIHQLQLERTAIRRARQWRKKSSWNQLSAFSEALPLAITRDAASVFLFE